MYTTKLEGMLKDAAQCEVIAKVRRVVGACAPLRASAAQAFVDDEKARAELAALRGPELRAVVLTHGFWPQCVALARVGVR